MGIVRDIITPILPASRGVEFHTVSAEELRRMDDVARKRELEAFDRDPSIRMPLSGYARGAVVDW